ncbi:MAG: T9SS sorting signal type C domain-containing protein [Weeksellaceae bacterium]
MKLKVLSFVWLLCAGFLSAQTTVIQNITSNQTYTVPCGVKEIKVEAVGGGGGGGYVTNSIFGNVSGGGGGGAYAASILSVSPGDTFNAIIGNGGTGLNSNNNGGDSSFSNFNGTIVLAKGGIGVSQNSTNGANGGLAAQSLGDIKFNGGNGGNADKGVLLWSGGGGGGGAGTPTQDGGNGADGFIFFVGLGGAGGSSSDPGGTGGRGANFGNERGDSGQIYGGGGGGSATMVLAGSRGGGEGAPGVIRITYTVEAGFEPPITEIEQINLDNDAIGCLTNTVILQADGGSLGNGASTLWFEGNDCLELAHIEEFTGFNFTGKLNNATFQGITDGVARLHTTTNDPQIDMTNIFSSQIDPVKYKYISIRYKVVGTQSAGNVEIYFKRNGQILSEERKVSRALISDDNYHIMNIDMSGHGQWNNDGGTHNITGWRFDFATVNDRTVMIDYIVLSSKPLIETTNNHNSNDTVLTYTLETESKTIGSMRIAEFLSTENNCDFTTQKTGCTYTTLVRKDKTYQGIGDWSEAAKWTFNSLPVSGSCVRIPSGSFATVDIPDAIAGTLIVNSGGKLEISDGSTLTVENGITNQATANDFVVKHDANLIQIENDAVNIGEITVEKNFNFSSQRKQYNFVTAPVVANRNIKETIYTPNPTSVQKYNTATDYFDETLGPYVSGLGYAVKEPANGNDTGEFMGVPFNGVLNYPLNTSGNRYNLLGNPYPSNLDILLLYNFNNTKFANADFYFWDNRNNTEFTQQGSGYEGVQYAMYNAVSNIGNPAPTNNQPGNERIPDRYVKVGTGFIIQASNTGGTLDFNNSYRTSEGDIGFFGKGFAPESQSDRYWLSMDTPGGIRISNAVVYFEGGNDAFAIDDTESFLGSDDLFTFTGEKAVAIQGKAPFHNDDKIQLGYKAFNEGTHIISVFKAEGIFAEEQNIYLVDKLLHKTVNLSVKPYKFLTRAGQFNDRFEIIYKNKNIFSTVQDTVEPLLITVTRQSEDLLIMSQGEKLSEVIVYNLLGKPVFTYKNLNTQELRIPAAEYTKQILIVNIVTQSGNAVSQKVIPK